MLLLVNSIRALGVVRDTAAAAPVVAIAQVVPHFDVQWSTLASTHGAFPVRKYFPPNLQHPFMSMRFSHTVLLYPPARRFLHHAKGKPAVDGRCAHQENIAWPHRQGHLQFLPSGAVEDSFCSCCHKHCRTGARGRGRYCLADVGVTRATALCWAPTQSRARFSWKCAACFG